MDIIMEELTTDNVEVMYGREREDGAITASVKIITTLDQFEILYSTIFQRMESDLRDSVSSMGFSIKDHNLVMHTQYLSKKQIDFLVENTVALMNGVIQAQNFKVQMIQGLKELNRQVLVMEGE